MKYDFEKYKDKLEALRNYLTEADVITPDVEVKLVLPGQEGSDSEIKVPYLLVCYRVDENRCHTRKIELLEHHLQDDIKELLNKITAMIEEFTMEVERNEFGVRIMLK